MLKSTPQCELFLRQCFGENWQPAFAQADETARRLQGLSWADRAKVLDAFLWTRALNSLKQDHITAVVNRQAGAALRSVALRNYARCHGALIAAVLLLLDEPLQAGDVRQLTVLAASQEPGHRETAAEGLADRFEETLEALVDTPGLAFLLLAMHPDDNAQSFAARDAFWQAMLGV